MKEKERKEQLNLSIESVKILEDIDTMIYETSDLMKKYSDNKELNNIRKKAIEYREFLIKATEKEIANSYDYYNKELKKINEWLSKIAKCFLKNNFREDEIRRYIFN